MNKNSTNVLCEPIKIMISLHTQNSKAFSRKNIIFLKTIYCIAQNEGQLKTKIS